MITQTLFLMGDTSYKRFISGLIPTLPQESILGIRTPMLRKYAKELDGSPEAMVFIQKLPHKYYEENNLHAFLIEGIKDFDTAVQALNALLPHVDNWSTCDSLCPKVLKKHPEELLPHIRRWLASDHVYTVRFGIELLMKFYLDGYFSADYPLWVANIISDEYYIRMMQAWYFATALAKQYQATIPYIAQRRLSPWVHNKAIQKAVESKRISQETKDFIKTFRRKEEEYGTFDR